VETGTFQGDTARALGKLFPSVVTIELADELFERALAKLADLPNVAVEHGTAPDLLRELEPAPTLYWLDAHWCFGETAGADDPCPVLEELAAIRSHPDDCYLIDDARLFAANLYEHWPTLVQVLDALREARPAAHVTVVHDLIVSVPAEAKDIVDRFGWSFGSTVWAAGEKARLAGSELDVGRRARLRRLVVSIPALGPLLRSARRRWAPGS
jgi:hypothetical protein